MTLMVTDHHHGDPCPHGHATNRLASWRVAPMRRGAEYATVPASLACDEHLASAVAVVHEAMNAALDARDPARVPTDPGLVPSAWPILDARHGADLHGATY